MHNLFLGETFIVCFRIKLLTKKKVIWGNLCDLASDIFSSQGKLSMFVHRKQLFGGFFCHLSILWWNSQLCKVCFKAVVNLCLHVCADIDLGLVKSPVLGYIILNTHWSCNWCIHRPILLAVFFSYLLIYWYWHLSRQIHKN